ncbi:ABC transporter ATP-binding protein [Microbacterium profundi]|uniref:ABC transporter ATP-binding protein n=1 Tax=Microbacterium profundi TaxID=450380 RepID=A0ABV3LKW9_9MICO
MQDIDNVITADNVTCSYGTFVAVDDISLQVRRGELYALLGTNGAGKTTVVETIEGHREPQSGSVTVLGGAPGDRTNIRPRMGMMLQDSGFAADLTVSETLTLLGELSGRSGDVGSILEQVDLAGRRGVRVGQLSGGERRRLDFAAAIFGDPELLVLDEPTNALDPEARDRLWAIVDRLRADGSTILLTTHYLEEAEEHADRVGLMHRGTLRAEGSVDQLVRDFPARISFETDFIPADLPVAVSNSDGQTVTIFTMEMQRDLFRLLNWAEDSAVTLRDLRASPAGLAEVFRQVASSEGPLPSMSVEET